MPSGLCPLATSWKLATGHGMADVAFTMQMSNMSQGSPSELLRPLEIAETLSGRPQIKAIFILKNSMPFSPSFSHKCTMEFSRGNMKCGITEVRMQKQTKNPAVFY